MGHSFRRSRASGSGADSGGLKISTYSIQGPTLGKVTPKQSDIFDLVLGILVIGISMAIGVKWNPAGLADRGSSWFGEAARVARSVLPEPSQAPQPAIEYFAHVDVPAAPIRVAPAVMTEQARAARFRGTVSVIVYVDSLGVPRQMEPASPVPFGLGNAIRLAVFQWRFRPAQRGGVAVAAKTAVEVPFQ
ncbi:MAG TPA: energy transducer TonB [Bryobacteraceae bacterium]|nr:energy transducer TonB [Bryobacteraceae bacterium]